MVDDLELDEGRAPLSRLLAGIEVEGLFGRYTYHIDVPDDSSGAGRLVLLHGDNGSGKTTLLKLLWHLLSPGTNRSHRTAIANTPFVRFAVHLQDGSRIVARKGENLIGSYEIMVQRPGQSDIVTPCEVDDRGSVVWGADMTQFSLPIEEAPQLTIRYLRSLGGTDIRDQGHEFISYLEQLQARPVYLADDRRLYSDDLDEAREIQSARRRGSGESPRVDVHVASELQAAIGRVNDHLRSLTIRAQAIGTAGANDIYRQVLTQLARRDALGPTEGLRIERTQELLDALEVRSPDFEAFGLVPHFDASEFRALLSAVPTDQHGLAEGIIEPYLASLAARYDALEEAATLLGTLVPLANRFLTDKRMISTPRRGLRIVVGDDDTELSPERLSSGERQLLMLLTTTVLASKEAGLFLIDEPELSLGVEWQRSIVDALLGLTQTTNLQFVIATHSIEVLSAHRDALILLGR